MSANDRGCLLHNDLNRGRLYAVSEQPLGRGWSKGYGERLGSRGESCATRRRVDKRSGYGFGRIELRVAERGAEQNRRWILPR